MLEINNFLNNVYCAAFYIDVSAWLKSKHICKTIILFFQVSISKERNENTKIVEEAETETYGAVVGVDKTSQRKEGVRLSRSVSRFVTPLRQRYAVVKLLTSLRSRAFLVHLFTLYFPFLLFPSIVLFLRFALPFIFLLLLSLIFLTIFPLFLVFPLPPQLMCLMF